jgi:hypothetical protein
VLLCHFEVRVKYAQGLLQLVWVHNNSLPGLEFAIALLHRGARQVFAVNREAVAACSHEESANP